MKQSTYPRNERDRQSPPYEKPGEIKSLNLRHRENEKRENPGLFTQTGKPLPHSPAERFDQHTHKKRTACGVA